jgi:two-component system response regulator PhoP
MDNAGFVVDVCSSIKEAWLFMIAHKPDVMVMAMTPSDKESLQALRRWRKMGENIRILVISNEENLQHKVNTLNGGADDYIVKPFRIEELLFDYTLLLADPAWHQRKKWPQEKLN